MTHYFDYPTISRTHMKRVAEKEDVPGSDKSASDYYAVLKGLLLRGGYNIAGLAAERGENFNLELCFLRRLRGATIDLSSYSASTERSHP